MGYAKFKNGDIYPAIVRARTNTTVEVVFDSGGLYQNTNGFVYNMIKEFTKPIGDYSAYTTVYRVTTDSVIFSNDGSVYPDPTPDTPEPSLKEQVTTLTAALTAAQIELTNTQVALTEVYELIGGN